MQHREDVVQDERLTSGKKELRHSYLNCFINQAADLWERESVALGPHKGLCHAITAGKIAVVVGIDPETMEQISPVVRRIGMSERHAHLPPLVSTAFFP